MIKKFILPNYLFFFSNLVDKFNVDSIRLIYYHLMSRSREVVFIDALIYFWRICFPVFLVYLFPGIYHLMSRSRKIRDALIYF